MVDLGGEYVYTADGMSVAADAFVGEFVDIHCEFFTHSGWQWTGIGWVWDLFELAFKAVDAWAAVKSVEVDVFSGDCGVDQMVVDG